MKTSSRNATELEESFFDLPAGARLGDWLIVRPIGAGRYGRVYEATYERRWRRRQDMPARAALKVFDASLLWSRSSQAALTAEAEAMWSISHPNVLRFHADVTLTRRSRFPGTRFFVLELGDCDLQEEANLTGEGLPAGQVTKIARDTLLGLKAVHQRLVHGDIKPENVIRVGDCYKIADMGVAARLEGTGA